jgi:hypothetical protein
MRIMEKFEDERIKGFVCDVCGKEVSEYEIGDVVSVDFTAGYDSVFGDGNKVRCDICGECLKAKLGEFIHVEEVEWPA